MPEKVVSIDCRMIRHSGIGTYIRAMTPRIFKELADWKFYCLGPVRLLEKEACLKSPNSEIVPCDAPIYSIQEQFKLPLSIPSRVQLHWSPHYNVPALYNGKLVTTVHDLFHRSMPQYVKGLHKQFYAKTMFEIVRRKSVKVFAVSQFVKEEILRHTYDPKDPFADKVKVIYNGVEGRFLTAPKSTRSPLESPYLLFMGNLKPHKNLMRTLKAFEKIRQEGHPDLKLVLMGKKDGFITGDQELLGEVSAKEDSVLMTGEISQDSEEFFAYIDHAKLLVMPSLYESFGLPALEGLARGVPALVSNVTAMPEVYKDCAYFCDPLVEESIRDQIHKALDESGSPAQQKMLDSGKRLAEETNWDKAAQAVIQELKQLI